MLKLMLVTDNIDEIIEAQDAGVDRIFFDLEYINKSERQKGRNTFISKYNINDISKIKSKMKTSELLVRINPINPNSNYEINKVVNDGADIVMLPMIIDVQDVIDFTDYVKNRSKTCLLLETAQSLVRIDDIISITGINEVFIGLNDLHISLNLSFMFELLSGGIIEYMSKKILNKNLPFGFGGIAKIGEGIFPAETILAEHYRLGSTSVILSRTFRNEVNNNCKINIHKEISKIRKMENEILKWSENDFLENILLIKTYIANIVKNI